MSAGANDLTKGSILKKMMMVAAPIMGTQLMQMAYNLTDMFWLGRMEQSVVAVAASGLAGMFLWLGMAPMMIGRMGAEIGTAQNLGRRDIDAAQEYAQTSTRLSMLLGTAYGLILILFAKPLVSLLMVKEVDVFNSTCVYLRIVGLGTTASFVAMAVTGVFTAAGRSKLSFWANAIGLILNMALDPLMILTFKWGIAGAAIATSTAEVIVCGLLIWFIKKNPHRPFAQFKLLGGLNRDKVRKILRWSLPVAMESGAFTALAMVVTGMVSSLYGQTAVAVQRVGSQIESISWLVGGGFATAVTAFIGQNYGARKWSRIRRGNRVALLTLVLWETVVTALLFFCGRFFFSLFLREPPEILDMGEDYLKILACCQLFMALEGTYAGTFRGLGRTMPPSACSIASNLVRPLLCWVLQQKMGLNGLWWGVAVSAALRGLMMCIWFLRYERKLPREDEPIPCACASVGDAPALETDALPGV